MLALPSFTVAVCCIARVHGFAVACQRKRCLASWCKSGFPHSVSCCAYNRHSLLFCRVISFAAQTLRQVKSINLLAACLCHALRAPARARNFLLKVKNGVTAPCRLKAVAVKKAKLFRCQCLPLHVAASGAKFTLGGWLPPTTPAVRPRGRRGDVSPHLSKACLNLCFVKVKPLAVAAQTLTKSAPD